jgi:hypothetical protein
MDRTGTRPDASDTPPRSRHRPDRPDHFSTYAPRDLVRSLKVIAAIRDLPMWAIVTDALEDYVRRYEQDFGRLPRSPSSAEPKQGKEP